MNFLKKPETYGIPTSRWVYALWESQKGKKDKGEILFDEIMGESPISGKGSRYSDSRSHKTLQKGEPRESIPWQVMSKLSKVKDKERIFKATRQKWLIMYKSHP